MNVSANFTYKFFSCSCSPCSELFFAFITNAAEIYLFLLRFKAVKSAHGQIVNVKVRYRMTVSAHKMPVRINPRVISCSRDVCLDLGYEPAFYKPLQNIVNRRPLSRCSRLFSAYSITIPRRGEFCFRQGNCISKYAAELLSCRACEVHHL